jgi:hypothetical protein
MSDTWGISVPSAFEKGYCGKLRVLGDWRKLVITKRRKIDVRCAIMKPTTKAAFISR